MQSEQLDSFINRVETAYRTSYALTRDLDQLRIDLKHMQDEAGNDNVNLEAFVEGVERALPVGIADAAVTATLRTKYVVDYCEKHGLSIPDAYNPMIPGQHEGAEILVKHGHQPVDAFAAGAKAVSSAAEINLPTAIDDLIEAARNAKPAGSLVAPMLPGEILTNQLSPAVFKLGRGFVKPGYGGLKEYQEGVPTGDFDTLARWPNGFFRDGRQTIDQFYLKTSSFFVLISGLSNVEAPPLAKVFMRSQNTTEPLNIQDLGVGERLMLSNELNTEFAKMQQ